MRTGEENTVVNKANEQVVLFADSRNLVSEEAALQVTHEEWEYASQQLAGKPDGTKLSCYTTSEVPVEYDHDGRGCITFTHTFLAVGMQLFAISNITQELILIYEKTEGITLREWDAAQQHFFEMPLGKSEWQRRIDSERKLRHRHKCYKTVTIANQEVLLKHHFIKINDVIYALAIPGWEKSGSEAKVKVAIDRDGKQVAIRMPYKHHQRRQQFNDGYQVECDIAKSMDFLLTDGTKISRDGARAWPIQVLPYIPMDFLKYCIEQKSKLKTIIHSQSEGSNSLIVNIRASILDALIKIARAIDGMHTKGVIHRDIKPPNILVDIDPITKQVRAVVIADFGFATRMNPTDPGKIKWNETLLGTKPYAAPEIIRSSGESIPYSARTDIYAFGVIVKQVSTEFFLRDDKALLDFSRVVTSYRLHLHCVQVFLIVHLFEYLRTNSQQTVLIDNLLQDYAVLLSANAAVYLYLCIRQYSLDPSTTPDSSIITGDIINRLSEIQKHTASACLFEFLNKHLEQTYFLMDTAEKCLIFFETLCRLGLSEDQLTTSITNITSPLNGLISLEEEKAKAKAKAGKAEAKENTDTIFHRKISAKLDELILVEVNKHTASRVDKESAQSRPGSPSLFGKTAASDHSAVLNPPNGSVASATNVTFGAALN